jgi:hypothetical protein
MRASRSDVRAARAGIPIGGIVDGAQTMRQGSVGSIADCLPLGQAPRGRSALTWSRDRPTVPARTGSRSSGSRSAPAEPPPGGAHEFTGIRARRVSPSTQMATGWPEEGNRMVIWPS